MPARNITVVAILAAAAAAMHGCKVGPEYDAPEAEVPDGWAETSISDERSIATSDPVVIADWWTTLNDATLSELIRQAVAGNYDVQIATARLREARAQRGIAAAAGLPQVDANAGHERFRDSENTQQGRFTSSSSDGQDLYSVGLDASWEIDVFGGIQRGVEAADADVQALVEDRRDVLVVLAAEVARNYVDVRGLQQRIAVTQSNIAIQADTLSITESRFNAGLVSELDVAQARAQLESTTAALPRLQSALRQAIHRIGVLLGKGPAERLDQLLVAAGVPAAPDRVPVGLPSDLLRRRPDVRRAEREIAAATARIGVATADLYPRFSLTGSFGLRSNDLGEIVDGDSRFWSIGPAVRWPIFQGGRIRLNIEAEEARTEQAVATYQRTVLTAFEDVENALVSFNREQARRTSLARAVDANRRAVQLALDLNKAGLTDFERVLDSQGNLAVSEELLAASDQAVLQSLIRLYTALGGGWETFAPEETAMTP